jgi:hypothetical protein
MRDSVRSETRLHAIFRIRVDGEPVTIQTVGEASRLLSDYRFIEWMQFYRLHKAARAALDAASESAVMARPATDAVRRLFRHAGLV